MLTGLIIGIEEIQDTPRLRVFREGEEEVEQVTVTVDGITTLLYNHLCRSRSTIFPLQSLRKSATSLMTNGRSAGISILQKVVPGERAARGDTKNTQLFLTTQ